MKKILITLAFILMMSAAYAAFQKFNPSLVTINKNGTLTNQPVPNTELRVSGVGSTVDIMIMPPSTQFNINAAALMNRVFGYNTDRISSHAPSDVFWGGQDTTIGAFRMSCNTSHMAFDDPVVYPRQPGKSHLHVFFGNTGITGNTDLMNLRNVGNTTCQGGTVNKSGYWVPAIIDTSTGFPVVPSSNNAYYKGSYVWPAGYKTITAPPVGFRMITGNPSNSVEGSNNIYRWDCFTPAGVNVAGGLHIPGAECVNGSEILLLVHFPECWDGVNLDSPNHQSHVAFLTNTGCPATHPVQMPTISFNVHYDVDANHRPENWRLSSDRYPLKDANGNPTARGLSVHGDWVNGWDLNIMNAFIRNCLHGDAIQNPTPGGWFDPTISGYAGNVNARALDLKVDCHNGVLADGRYLNG
jgi:hypothetical protein